jgi:type IV secretory pathway TraG/TraD family ATPase VirD4
MSSPTSPRTGNDAFVNIGLGGLVAVAVFGVLLRVAGSIAALLTGHTQPDADLTAGMRVLGSPLDPGAVLGASGLNPFVYWAVVLLLLGAVTAATIAMWRLFRRGKGRTDPRRLGGAATGPEIAAVASPRALLRRAGTFRPSLEKPQVSDIGYLLGTSRGRQVWATVEDSILLIGPPRSGKGLHIVINAVLDAPGAVVTTSTRPDNLTATMRARQKHGPAAVFDPQRIAPGLSAGLRWSPVRGCEDPLTAMIRANGLSSATNFGSVSGGDFWQGKTTAAIQGLLHAAALDHRDASALYSWALSPTAAGDAARILQSNPRAAEGWAESLESMLQSDPRTRDSIWQGVALAFSALADPRVLDAVSPRTGEEFDPERFLNEHGTLFLLATGAGAGASASLVAAFIEDLVEVARKLAARSPGARLDPPLLLALDEIGNLSPLPSLPTLMAEGGGTGITTLPVLQSLAQAREKWGENSAAAIWDASIVKIIHGGASNSRDLQDLSALVGERDEITDSVTIGDYGSRSSQR